MIYLRKLFTQDLRDGKQIAFPKEPSLQFFNFDFSNGDPERRIKFIFDSEDSQYSQYNGKVIQTRLYPAGSEARIDGELKAFIRDYMEAKVNDILCFNQSGRDAYTFKFIQQGTPMYSLYLKLINSQNHTVVLNSIQRQSITNPSEGILSSTSYLPYLTALRTKPFMLLAGISGTGKSRIVRELAFKSCPSYLQDEDGTTPGNYCMIEVKPNWHDSSELLGYYSNIAKQYVFTDFVKFLLKAKLYSDVPFFVCLDEMNLAPVEQYFAEFLSVLETRKQTESGIKTGALVKGNYFKRIKSVNEYDNVQTDADVYTLLEIPITAEQKEELAKTNSLKTDGLTLPENVFVIGTVNMDDTTHQFSRKVLDRAMTIEMNGGELKDMFGHSSDLEYLPEEKVWKIDQFKPKHVNADEVLEEHIDSNGDLDETGIAFKTQLADKLDAINQVLKDTPFVVSYRVLNELVIYAGVLLDDGKETEEAINDAVDQITLMKILPRIEGDEDLLGNAKDENNRLCQLLKVVGPKSQAKIKEMNRRLVSGFTRFWP